MKHFFYIPLYCFFIFGLSNTTDPFETYLRTGLLFQITIALNIPRYYNANITDQDRKDAGRTIKNFLNSWKNESIKNFLQERVHPYKRNNLSSNSLNDPICVYRNANNTKVIGKIFLNREEYKAIYYMYEKIFKANIATLTNGIKIMKPKKTRIVEKENDKYFNCYELKFTYTDDQLSNSVL